jgi:hypothetical protein
MGLVHVRAAEPAVPRLQGRWSAISAGQVMATSWQMQQSAVGDGETDCHLDGMALCVCV